MSSDTDSSGGSDGSEDIPLAALGGKHLRPPGFKSDESSSSEEEEEFEFEENGDDSAHRQQQQQQEEEEEEEEEEEPSSEEEEEPSSEEDDGSDEDFREDEDDDVPLAALKSPKGKKAPAKKKAAAGGKKKEKTPAAKKKTSAKAKKPASKKKASPAKKKANGSVKSSASESGGDGPLTASGQLYAKCEKGRLIRSVLCRWWYCATWPDTSSIPPCPRGYDALDGFPGVYVCTAGDDVGKIADHRDPKTCPSFANYARKTSEELVEMLVEAIGKQREQLIEAEGSGTDTERDLDELESWARRLNTAKADREADRVLRAARIEL